MKATIQSPMVPENKREGTGRLASALDSPAACLRLFIGYCPKQEFPFLDLICPYDEDIPDAPHPCGRRPPGNVLPEQFRECLSGDLHNEATFQIEMYPATENRHVLTRLKWAMRRANFRGFLDGLLESPDGGTDAQCLSGQRLHATMPQTLSG